MFPFRFQPLSPVLPVSLSDPFLAFPTLIINVLPPFCSVLCHREPLSMSYGLSFPYSLSRRSAACPLCRGQFSSDNLTKVVFLAAQKRDSFWRFTPAGYKYQRARPARPPLPPPPLPRCTSWSSSPAWLSSLRLPLAMPPCPRSPQLLLPMEIHNSRFTVRFFRFYSTPLNYWKFGDIYGELGTKNVAKYLHK